MKLRLLLPPLLPRPLRLPPPLKPSPLKLLLPLPLRLLTPSPLKPLLPLPLRPLLAPPLKTRLPLLLPTPKRSNLFAVEKKPTCGLAFFTPSVCLRAPGNPARSSGTKDKTPDIAGVLSFMRSDQPLLQLIVQQRQDLASRGRGVRTALTGQHLHRRRRIRTLHVDPVLAARLNLRLVTAPEGQP